MSKVLSTERNGLPYYSFSPHPKWRFIILDPFEISVMNPATKVEALAYLKKCAVYIPHI